jgi:membrane associated rhomboid family serine protease
MITYIIIGITAVLSFMAFQNDKLMEKMQFNAALIVHKKEYYRLISHAFIHVGWSHLIVNMLVLFFFGRAIEDYLSYLFGNKAVLYFIILYIGGILISNLWGLIKNQNNYYYNAVGASGAVSAVLFSFIFLNPLELLYLFAIIPIPGILFGIGYLFYSYQMGKRKSDNVAHDAHFLGAVFGFIYPVILQPGLFEHFIDQLFSFL